MKCLHLYPLAFALSMAFAAGAVQAAVGHGPHLFHGKRGKSYSSEHHQMQNPKRRASHSRKARRHKQSTTAFASAPPK